MMGIPPSRWGATVQENHKMKGAYANKKRRVCVECGKPQLIQALRCTEEFVESQRIYVRTYTCRSKHKGRQFPYLPRER